MTAQALQMEWLMDALKQRQMYFLIVAQVRQLYDDYAVGIPSNRLHVFLDNDPSLEQLRSWRRVELIAENQGYAIVIGHPYPTTLQFYKSLRSNKAVPTSWFIFLSYFLPDASSKTATRTAGTPSTKKFRFQVW